MKNENDTQSEKARINLAKKDSKEFAELYKAYYKRIFFYVKSRVNGNHELAEDLTSTIFEKALKNIKSFQWQGISFSAWIYKIANNTLIDYYRSQNKSKNDTEIHENINDNTNIESAVTQYDNESRIKSLLDELPSRDKEILILKFYEGFSNKSIAEQLKISETNVSTIIHRNMGKLRKMILARADIDI